MIRLLATKDIDHGSTVSNKRRGYQEMEESKLSGHRESMSRCGPQPRQHLEPGITIGRRHAGLDLEIVDRLHGILAHAAIGSIRIEAERCQTALNFLNFG